MTCNDEDESVRKLHGLNNKIEQQLTNLNNKFLPQTKEHNDFKQILQQTQTDKQSLKDQIINQTDAINNLTIEDKYMVST